MNWENIRNQKHRRKVETYKPPLLFHSVIPSLPPMQLYATKNFFNICTNLIIVDGVKVKDYGIKVHIFGCFNAQKCFNYNAHGSLDN